MPLVEQEISDFTHELQRNIVRQLGHHSVNVDRDGWLTARIKPGHSVQMKFAALGDQVGLLVRGSSPEASRAVRNALVGKARDAGDIASNAHLIDDFDTGTLRARRSRSEAIRKSMRWFLWISDATTRTPVDAKRGPALKGSERAVYWWDERPNFGDAVGPWLVQAMSGHEPVNARRRKELSPVLWAVDRQLAIWTVTTWTFGARG